MLHYLAFVLLPSANFQLGSVLESLLAELLQTSTTTITDTVYLLDFLLLLVSGEESKLWRGVLL
jgi:hypothetical protein